eukprot:8147595-Prorocentrum_lima.AAC.1
MTSSLVGSEMCIRDSTYWTKPAPQLTQEDHTVSQPHPAVPGRCATCNYCLLYTSDAADDM